MFLLLDTNLIGVYYCEMINLSKINSVSKNNFLSLMRSYEKNYITIFELIDLNLICPNNISKKFESKSKYSNKKLLLTIESVSNHTALIRFSYNLFSNDTYINFVDIKIYFDSKQIEVLNTNSFSQNNFNKKIQNFHNLRLSKWYKSYFLSIWLDNCVKNGYSFDVNTTV